MLMTAALSDSIENSDTSFSFGEATVRQTYHQRQTGGLGTVYIWKRLAANHLQAPCYVVVATDSRALIIPPLCL